jgi:uncharacterized protein (DUF58 family)
VLAPWAESLGAALPPLVVEAERVATTVMPGVHGRRRAGPGEAFWQFRPYVLGDAVARIDLRETEWEAAQTVALWSATDPGMEWRSSRELPTKVLRAQLLLLALASLLFRGGERVRLFGLPRPFAGRSALPALAESLPRMAARPADPVLPRHARAVVFGDLLAPLDETAKQVATLSAQGVRGHMLQVVDPAEEALPYAGRVQFQDPGAGPDALIPRVEAVRGLYAERLARHRDGLRALATSTGWRFGIHRTDQPPETALLALVQALSPA